MRPSQAWSQSRSRQPHPMTCGLHQPRSPFDVTIITHPLGSRRQTSQSMPGSTVTQSPPKPDVDPSQCLLTTATSHDEGAELGAGPLGRSLRSWTSRVCARAASRHSDKRRAARMRIVNSGALSHSSRRLFSCSSTSGPFGRNGYGLQLLTIMDEPIGMTPGGVSN